MCVAIKRKLLLFYWKNNEFLELMEDINLSDIPRALTWCEETLCVGFRGEYSLYDVSSTTTYTTSYFITKIRLFVVERKGQTNGLVSNEQQQIL